MSSTRVFIMDISMMLLLLFSSSLGTTALINRPNNSTNATQGGVGVVNNTSNSRSSMDESEPITSNGTLLADTEVSLDSPAAVSNFPVAENSTATSSNETEATHKVITNATNLAQANFTPSIPNTLLSVLPALQEMEKVHQESTNNHSVIRENNVDVLPNGTAVCRIVDMLFHSRVGRDGKRIHNEFFSLPLQTSAAIALALEHLNTGNGRVVPEVQGLNERCDVRFVSEFLDTAGQVKQAVYEARKLAGRENHLPCALSGAFYSSVSTALATNTAIDGYPQISSVSTSVKLNDKEQFPLFGRLASTVDKFSIPLLDYLYNELNIRHLAVAFRSSDLGLSYLDGVLNTQAELYPDLNIKHFTFPVGADAGDWKILTNQLAETEMRFFFVFSTAPNFEAIMLEAEARGIAGTGKHNWIFTEPSIHRQVSGSYPLNSPLLKASRGVSIFSHLGSADHVGRYNQFVDAWTEFSKSQADMEYLQSKLPQYPDSLLYDPVVDASVFQTFSPAFPLIPVFYDTAILLGLAACNARANFTGKEHYESIVRTEFEGASGRVTLDAETGSRNVTSNLFQLLNFVTEEDSSTGNSTIRMVEAALYADGRWHKKKSLVFNDGTEALPADLGDVPADHNYIGTLLRLGGLTMSAIIMGLALACSIWTVRFQESSRVVRASQPVFLHLICLGTGIMGSSIIPLSFDEEVSTNLDGACTAVPWLLALGWCLSFSALFSKTLRINRIFYNPNFRRVKVTAWDVARPMALLWSVNTFILSLWTVVDPISWRRTEIEVDRYERTIETSGACHSQNPVPFFSTLLFVNLLGLGFCIFQSYVARKIATEFSESEYIARAMSLNLVVVFMAIPVSVIAWDNPRARFFNASALIFIMSASLLLFIFVPKIIANLKPNSDISDAVRSSMKFIRESTACSVDDEADDNGTLVTDHPKLRAAVLELVQTLTGEKRELEKQINGLKNQILLHDRQRGGSSNHSVS